MIRRSLVRVRDGLHRRLHPRRRERARARLSALRPRRVLFVCLGNICRSPYAAEVLRSRSAGLIEVDSAGFIGPDRAPPSEALRVAQARGVRHAEHRSKLLHAEVLDRSDAVFVFDGRHARRLFAAHRVRRPHVFWLGDFDPEWAGKRAIPDPWGKPVEEFETTFERIERCVGDVLTCLPGAAKGA